jgi:hypothetical protein
MPEDGRYANSPLEIGNMIGKWAGPNQSIASDLQRSRPSLSACTRLQQDQGVLRETMSAA